MNDFLQHLKQRKLVQWAIAYVAGAWALLQLLDLVGQEFGWPGVVMRSVTVVLAIGFFVALVLAWYHGERGAQRVGGIELVMLAALLVIAAVAVTWVHHQYGQGNTQVARTHTPAATGKAVSAAAVAATTSAPKAATVASPIAAQPIPAKSVAVLPFENLSTDKANAYFADGMQDLILTKLADIGDLKVISRTSTMQYGSHPQNLKVIARQLGVATILEGSVQKSGNQVLINVQLIDAQTDSHIWAESYTRTLDNIFGVEGEVAQKVADALKAKLTSAETARVTAIPTTNTAAYDLFLKGEYYFARADQSLLKSDFEAATRNYREATQQDPEFALAYARLAIAQLVQFHLIGDDGSDLVVQVKKAADHALALAPHLAEAHLAQGLYSEDALHDFAAALASMHAVLAIKPQDAEAIFDIGIMQRRLGQWDASITSFQHAIALDPRHVTYLIETANSYMFMRRYTQAERVLQQALAIDPTSTRAAVALANVYLLQSGDQDRAIAVLDELPSNMQNNPGVISTRYQIALYRHDYAAARQLVAELKPGSGTSAAYIERMQGDLEWEAGNQPEARQHYSRSVALLEAALKSNPKDAVNAFAHGDLGWDYARLARSRDALEQGQLGIKLHPMDKDVLDGSQALFNAIQIQAQVGQVAEAVAGLNRLLAMPAGYYVSVPLLKLDPAWDPIRHDPRFQALLKKYGNVTPANASTAVPATTVAGTDNPDQP